MWLFLYVFLELFWGALSKASQIHARTQNTPTPTQRPCSPCPFPSIRDGSAVREKHLEGFSPQDTQESSCLDFGSVFILNENL